MHARIAMAILQTAALYTMVVTLIGHWYLHIPLSETIRAGFGNDRFAWLLLGLSIDVLARLHSLFDPE